MAQDPLLLVHGLGAQIVDMAGARSSSCSSSEGSR